LGRRIGVLATALLWAATPASAAPQHKVYLTAEATDGVPSDKAATDFGCTDTIYAVIELTGASTAKHHLEAVWRDPAGKDRERTRYPFWVGRDQERIWVWLKLHRPTEAALVQFLNPSAGMDEFIGEWQIHLLLDDQPLGIQKFKVLC
jgi:hypothetical protein